MPLYSPPSGNNVNFELKTYTPPSGDSVNFTLEGAQPETKSSQFLFSWILYKQFTSSFWFYWNLLKTLKNLFTFSWRLHRYEKLYHITSYPLLLTTPVISEFSFTSGVAGILDSISINFQNTGKSGKTKISFLVNSQIIQTLEIEANNSSLDRNISFKNKKLVYTGDKITVKIEEVANDCSNLQLSIKQKTCSPEFKIEKFYNEYKGVQFESPFLFGKADKWIFILSQPIQKILNIRGQSIEGGDIIFENFSLKEGNLGKNLIEVEPQSLRNYDFLVISALNLNGETVIAHLEIKYYYDFSAYPEFISKEFSFLTKLEAIKCYYSWDNYIYYEVPVENGNIDIKFLPSSSGKNTFYIKYYFDEYGQKVVYDEVEITYVTGEPECEIDSEDFTLSYTDEIPPKKVEVIVDSELKETKEISVYIKGFDSYEYNNETYELTLSEGKVYFGDKSLSFDKQTFKVIDSIDMNSEEPFESFVLGYDTSSNTFYLKKIEGAEKTVYLYPELESQSFIPLWNFTFSVQLEFDEEFNPVFSKFTLISAEKVYCLYSLPVYIGDEVVYKVYDVLDRVKEFKFNRTHPKTLDYFYQLKVYDSNGNEIKPGEIHFETSLTYKMTEL